VEEDRLEEDQMTPEQIRTLLGGYATNTLTESERKMLFEAALEDQELFNALHDEDALRDLLADPASRDAIRRALEEPARAKQSVYWPRRWAFSTAAAAVAAGGLVTLAIWLKRLEPSLVPVQVASQQAASKSEATSKEATSKQETPQSGVVSERRQEIKKKSLDAIRSAQPAPTSPPPMPAPVIPAPVQVDAAREAVPAQASFRAAVTVASPLPAAVLKEFSAGYPANAPLYSGPLVRYSLFRTSPAADRAIDTARIDVFTGVAGYLALYQLDPSGGSKRLFPASTPAVFVAANSTSQIPSVPIPTSATQEKLRLVIVPAAEPKPAAVGGFAETSQNAMQKAAIAPTPLVVDIALPKN
jgi:hypothetical protein